MESYPSIGREIRNIPVYAYDKLDGSNIRVEWTRKNYFTKFGSRNQLIDETHPHLGESLQIFDDKYAAGLDHIFRKERVEKMTVFLEFFGPSSFAGFHEPNEKHDLLLFDAYMYKRGMLPPVEFNKMFRNVPTVPLLYTGNCNQPFVDQVKNGILPGMTFEGVVCKAGYDARNRPVVFKVKNQAWLSKLKTKCAGDERMFERLS